MTGRDDLRPGMRARAPRPRTDMTGSYYLTDAAIAEAERLLPTYRGPDGDHEGMAFLAGVELDGGAMLLTTAIAPDCEHAPGRVLADEDAVRAVTRAAHARGLGVLAQVHTHPGGWTEHSLGDDNMVLLPFDGMLSIVVAHYGRNGMRPLNAQGVHQYRDGRWHLAHPDAVRRAVTIVPSGLDLR